MKRGVVYSETVVFSPPVQFEKDAPYQMAIISLYNGKRLTVRISGEHISIGDKVVLVEERLGISWFRRE